MLSTAFEAATDESEVLARLSALCGDKGLDALSSRLRSLARFVGSDMRKIDGDLSGLLESKPRSVVERGALHLLRQGGKRLRPLCVALAARLGKGFGPSAHELAIAVELVHNATLLHDDVVDLGERRRGEATARALYGNAASIFAGDWLLIEALRRVHRAGVPQVLEQLLGTIDEMIAAEALQLEGRGKLTLSHEAYFRVVEGKTASLFRWALMAGGRAGGLDEATCARLCDYGHALGVAFQLTDDVLDYTGNPALVGKALLSDLREGKLTFPLLIALERDPSLAALLEEHLAIREDEGTPEEIRRRVLACVESSGAIAYATNLARSYAERAIASIQGVSEGKAREALTTVALATVYREM